MTETIQNRPRSKIRILWLALSILLILALIFPIVQTIAYITTQEANAALSPQEHLEAGLQYLEGEEYNLALFEFNQAIDGDPDYLDAYFERGKLYQMAGEAGIANAHFTIIIRRNPDHAQAYYYRALTYLALGDLLEQANQAEDATIQFDTLIEPGPLLNIASTPAQAAVLPIEEISLDVDEETLASLNEGDEKSYTDFYNENEIVNPYQRALEDLSLAIEYQPDYTEALFTRAYLIFSAGNFSQAIDDLNPVIDAEPDDITARATWAILLSIGALCCRTGRPHLSRRAG
ncbi:MAG: tetratricopeptide repeat protein [Anaerolineae bacterium]|nr:tetratricopeptide repeat protein [Anaerolineae bacterium]